MATTIKRVNMGKMGTTSATTITTRKNMSIRMVGLGLMFLRKVFNLAIKKMG